MKQFILLILLATPVSAETWTVPVSLTGGGLIERYQKRIEELNRNKTFVQIDKGGCSSACTFFLWADSVCVHPRTVFEFHGPSANITMFTPLPFHGLSEEKHDEWVQWMVDKYNNRWLGLGNWFKTRASDKFGFGTVNVTGQALHDALGVPICEIWENDQ